MGGFHWSTVPPGGRGAFWLATTIGMVQPVAVPALVVRGATAGPTLMATAGVHGDEFEGMLAIQAFAAELEPTSLAGTFVGIPVTNPLAFAAGARETPPAAGGGNLARVFPGRSSGNVTEQLAAALFELIGRLIGPDDLFIDLHSAGSRMQCVPLVGFRNIEGPARSIAEAAARRFGVRQVWQMQDHPGTLSSEVARTGVPALGAEIRGRGGMLADDVYLYQEGLRNLAAYRRMVPGPPPPGQTAPTRVNREVAVRASGLLVPTVELGERIEAGVALAEVRDPFGARIEQVVASIAGELWGLHGFGSIREGETAVWIGCDLAGAA